ncbi:dephospho-CoA kinase [Flaviflexus huanghaiensis]|uniref:dephospho-CoA kinase n=1 Tax=Flaviflexus huanghaiensis TaxID=1111473 RepID=UPI0015FC4EF1|nr:dephospho-CoA kinase [Flaviflexus huanghaiensis]
MLYVGLTGGIASGKSLVAPRLAEAGMRVMDADAISRSLTAPGGAAVPAVAQRFPGIVHDGVVDREALSDIVFKDAERLAELNAIVHPLVHEGMRDLFQQYVTEDPDAIVVEESPLLIETGRGYVPQFLIVITTPDDTRVHRLVEHRGMSVDEARTRISTQFTDEERTPFADAVIDNSGSLAHLDEQIQTVIDRVTTFHDNVRSEHVPHARGRHIMHAERLTGKLAHTGVQARVKGMDVIVPAGTPDANLRHVCCIPHGDVWVRPDSEAYVEVRFEGTP